MARAGAFTRGFLVALHFSFPPVPVTSSTTELTSHSVSRFFKLTNANLSTVYATGKTAELVNHSVELASIATEKSYSTTELVNHSEELAGNSVQLAHSSADFFFHAFPFSHQFTLSPAPSVRACIPSPTLNRSRQKKSSVDHEAIC
jgi:hypothetical protein